MGEGNIRDSASVKWNKEDKGKGMFYRQLPEDEYLARGRKGLCFTCDEKFPSTHVCKNKTLKIMFVDKLGMS